jgi:hypothetical protein
MPNSTSIRKPRDAAALLRRAGSPAERHGPVTSSVRKYAQDRNISLAKVT